MQLQDALDQFLVQLDADGRSPHTTKQYRRHVRAFGCWLRDAGHAGEIESVTRQDIARFFASPTAQRRADGAPRHPSSANALRTSLSCFCRYLHDAGLIASNPARILRRAICGPGAPRSIPADDERRLLDAMAAGKDPESRRDHVLFGTLAATGMRIGSALALDVADIDLDRGEIRLRRMKGGQTATVFVPAPWVAHLRRHLDAVKPGPVFVSWHGTRLSQRHAQRRLAEWCRRAGLPRTYSPHAFRHAFALRVYERTRDIGVVQAALAHRSITSTMVYARPSPGQIRAAVGAV